MYRTTESSISLLFCGKGGRQEIRLNTPQGISSLGAHRIILGPQKWKQFINCRHSVVREHHAREVQKVVLMQENKMADGSASMVIAYLIYVEDALLHNFSQQ